MKNGTAKLGFYEQDLDKTWFEVSHHDEADCITKSSWSTVQH